MVSELAEDEELGDDILQAMQNFVSMFEKVFRGSLKLHLVAEDRQAHLIPLYSNSLVCAFDGDCHESSAVLSSLADDLATADKARKAMETDLQTNSGNVESDVSVTKLTVESGPGNATHAANNQPSKFSNNDQSFSTTTSTYNESENLRKK